MRRIQDSTRDEINASTAPSKRSLLSKIPLLRATHTTDAQDESPSKAAAPSPPRSKARLRSRTGSLRKVALLGGSLRSRDKRAEEHGAVSPQAQQAGTQDPESLAATDIGTPGQVTPLARPQAIEPDARAAASASEASTTDEEETRTNERRKSQRADDSYFPPISTTAPSLPPPRRHLSKRGRSPLAGPSYSAASLSASTTASTNLVGAFVESDNDDSETARWGWVLLAATWLMFVVGVGSCLGVWSWAWDVGRTPYAPPELEDDPTLPIVGYYPALIVLTGVVAWVWVGVAWMGMKYFRHAKISGEG